MNPDPAAGSEPPAGTGELSQPIPLDSWEGCSAVELRDEWRLPGVHLFSSAGSTNDLARKLAAEGASAGTLVIAELQVTGRGRAGRHWFSPSGLGLYLSFVARPATDEVAAYPLRMGVAAGRALDRWARSPVRIKWPNDLFVGGRKLGGVLCEGVWEGDRVDYLVVGIGINVLHSADDFPPAVRPFATSLREEAGGISRFDVATSLVSAIRDAINGSSSSSRDDWIEELRSRDHLLGQEIDVLEPNTGRLLLSGTAAGIERDGSLRLATDRGIQTVRSGTVRSHTPPAS